MKLSLDILQQIPVNAKQKSYPHTKKSMPATAAKNPLKKLPSFCKLFIFQKIVHKVFIFCFPKQKTPFFI